MHSYSSDMADVLNGQKEIHIVMDIIYINLNEYITSIDIHVYIYMYTT